MDELAKQEKAIRAKLKRHREGTVSFLFAAKVVIFFVSLAFIFDYLRG